MMESHEPGVDGIGQISFLADRPDFIPALAAGTLAEWKHIWPDRTLDWRVARLETHLNRHQPPIAWVIHDDDRVFGTAALRNTDFDGYEHLTPWLGGVFVFPEWRGVGYGSTLCAMVEREAAARGASKLYLGTFDNRIWYETFGWRILHTATRGGFRCDIMSKSLA